MISKYPPDIDASVLLKILKGHWKAYLIEKPSLELCRHLVMLRDYNISGRINLMEIPVLLHMLHFWKVGCQYIHIMKTVGKQSLQGAYQDFFLLPYCTQHSYVFEHVSGLVFPGEIPHQPKFCVRELPTGTFAFLCNLSQPPSECIGYLLGGHVSMGTSYLY